MNLHLFLFGLSLPFIAPLAAATDVQSQYIRSDPRDPTITAGPSLDPASLTTLQSSIVTAVINGSTHTATTETVILTCWTKKKKKETCLTVGPAVATITL